MSNRNPIQGVLGVVLAVMLLSVIWMGVSIFNRPRWELTAINVKTDIRIDIFREGEEVATYSTLLPNHQVTQSVNRVTIDELPKHVGQTSFTDETLKPGRWKLVIDGVELDIMERALIIDGEEELRPTDVND
jgi:hypothetical protein